MTYEAKVVEDSINPHNKIRLTTFQLTYPRFIHGEVMTHRVFSRNASSSRAIPVKTFLKQVWKNPAMPVRWGANKPGMQANEDLTGFKLWFTKFIWKFTGKLVCSLVWTLNKFAAPHKQIINRLLEPWQFIHVVVTATEWENFFALRNHQDAQPEIKLLAELMQSAMNESIPPIRNNHLPYITLDEKVNIDSGKLKLEDAIKCSTARCARVSYLTHDGNKPSIENDMKLYSRLVDANPPHLSPTEHPASAAKVKTFINNFKGWQQHRYQVEQRTWNK